MHKQPQRVVIVGGGIVGLSCAYYARRAGLDVVVVDPLEARARASFGNAGILAVCEPLPLGTPAMLKALPGMLLSKAAPVRIDWRYLPQLAPWLVRFVRACAPARVDDASRALAVLLSHALAAHDELSTAADARALIRATGWLKAYESRAAYEGGAHERDTLAALGVPMRALDRDEVDALAPGLAGLFNGGTLYTACRQVADPGTYVDRIGDACRALGVTFIADRVRAIAFADGTPCAVDTSAQRVSGDLFVIACGAWSKALAAELGDAIPLDTERGYHAMLDVGDKLVAYAPLLWHEQGVLLSQMDMGLRITNGIEFAGLHAPPHWPRLERSLAAFAAASGLRAPVLSRWLGFRPSLPDSLPVIGRARRHRNCFLAFGHGHLGLTLGPVTGKLIVQLMRGEPLPIALDPFDPARFSR